MIIPEIELAQSITQLFKSKNIQHIVISPGSRNAPLTIGFTNDPFFTSYSIVDERCAAFFGLGIAQQTNHPVALICTSGSALLNYYPAFTEAFYSQIPLIVVSADRPLNKIDIGDGQTIRQANVFQNHALFNANLTENASVDNDLLILNAIENSINKKGPVHINAPFEEPLYNTINKETYQINPNLNVVFEKESIDLSKVSQILNKSKIVILIGSQNPEIISQENIDFIASLPNVVILTEINSNVHHPNIVSNIDTLITSFTEEDFKNFQPDLLITFGGMIVSKRVKAMFRNYKETEHWHVDELRAYNTFGILTDHFKCSANYFINYLKNIDLSSIKNNFASDIKQLMNQRKIGHEKYLQSIPFSDLKVFDIIWKHLPNNIQLQISNSAVIRYAQLFDTSDTIDVFCNRGTSGIDGSTSTAIGAAVVSQKPTVLITGDISFFYDSNGLWNNYTPNNFKIIIINNSGGGIFRILPGHQENVTFNTFFETQHNLTAKHLSSMYDYEYLTANNEKELTLALKLLFENKQKKQILEVFTPTNINRDLLRNYFKSIS